MYPTYNFWFCAEVWHCKPCLPSVIICITSCVAVMSAHIFCIHQVLYLLKYHSQQWSFPVIQIYLTFFLFLLFLLSEEADEAPSLWDKQPGVRPGPGGIFPSKGRNDKLTEGGIMFFLDYEDLHNRLLAKRSRFSSVTVHCKSPWIVKSIKLLLVLLFPAKCTVISHQTSR